MSILDRLPFRWRKIGVVHITAAVGIICSLKVRCKQSSIQLAATHSMHVAIMTCR
jgi:hypothetical protein